MIIGVVALATLVAAGSFAASDLPGGAVRGEGWIASPPGAYLLDPELAARAEFIVDVASGGEANVAQGRVAFDLGAGALVFESTSVDWMLLSAETVKISGTGTAGGRGEYRFFLTAEDSTGGEALRLKVWDETAGTVVYDNLPVIPRGYRYARSANLGGGSIVFQGSDVPSDAAVGGQSGAKEANPVLRWR